MVQPLLSANYLCHLGGRSRVQIGMNGVEGDGVGNWTCRKWMCASEKEF